MSFGQKEKKTKTKIRVQYCDVRAVSYSRNVVMFGQECNYLQDASGGHGQLGHALSPAARFIVFQNLGSRALYVTL